MGAGAPYPAHHRSLPAGHSHACRKLPACIPLTFPLLPSLCFPLHPPDWSVNQPGLKPACKRGGWFALGHELCCSILQRWLQWNGAQGACGSSTGYLEINSEAQRGQSCLRKQSESWLIFPSVTETAEALPGTAGTGNSDGAVCGLQWGKMPACFSTSSKGA